jgi:hypothetical protein
MGMGVILKAITALLFIGENGLVGPEEFYKENYVYESIGTD